MQANQLAVQDVLKPWQWEGKEVDAPLRLRKPRLIEVPDLWCDAAEWDDAHRDRLFAVMALTPQHTYMLTTERPEGMAEYFVAGDVSLYDRWSDAACPPGGVTDSPCAAGVVGDADFPIPNLMLGARVTDQQTADERIPHLMRCPAKVRVVDVVLRGAVDLKIRETVASLAYGGRVTAEGISSRTVTRGIHWVIASGDSGLDAVPCHPDWVRSLRDQCLAAGVPFFFKQWGEWVDYVTAGASGWERTKDKPLRGRVRDGPLDGREFETAYPWRGDEGMSYGNVGPCMIRVGKKLAGRLLDGRTWDEMPGVQDV